MPSRIRDIVEVAYRNERNDDDNGATDWNKTIKGRLQGRQPKDGSITDFFWKKRGRKRKFDRERAASRATTHKRKTLVTTETVTRAKQQGRQWMAVTTRSIVTSREYTYEEIVVHARKNDGHWIATDDSETENDEESSISSCSDSVPEPRVKPALPVTRQKVEQAGNARKCRDWSLDENFEVLKGAILNACLPKASRRADAEAFP
mmetsp:Transcript_15586/g.23067  ORF Transcript_15586/g.23067 Transcript_15586/m.23067 type:complete len:205 (-) Transcript_15586:1618-2232(-)